MKLSYLFSTLLSLFSFIVVNAQSHQLQHSFTSCQKNPIMIIDSFTLSPNSPKTGKSLQLNISGNLSENVETANAVISIHSYGIKVLTKTIDICKITLCPILSGQVDFIFKQKISTLALPGSYDVNINVDKIFCINTKLKVVKTNLY